jgi:hypothetical protein
VAEIIDLAPELARRFSNEMNRKYDVLRAKDSEMPASTSSYYQHVRSAAVRFIPDVRILHWDNARIARP